MFLGSELRSKGRRFTTSVSGCGCTVARQFAGVSRGASTTALDSTSLRVDREFMFAGLFYAVEGMNVGGTRRIRVAPHLAYRETGVPGIIPPNALLIVEIHVVAARDAV